MSARDREAPGAWAVVSEWAWSLLFPPCCAGCQRGLPVEEMSPINQALLAGFCQACQDSVFPLQDPRCSTCGHPLSETATTCKRCAQYPPAFNKAWSLFAYAGALRSALHRYKFRGDHAAGRTLQVLMTRQCQHLSMPWEKYDLALSTPLHPKRLRQRGFNQAWQLLCGVTKIPPHKRNPDLLQRLKETRPQYQLSHHERQDNLEQAFCVPKHLHRKVQGKTILLIDDLLTTGATAHQCSVALRQAGAHSVEVLTLCRAIL